MADSVRTDVAIVGAGAAGLWAASRIADVRDTLVIEKTPRTGTKILASGGTHCNLTTTLDPSNAARTFGKKASRFLAKAFRVLTPEDVREAFHEWGVETVEAPLEKIFPASGKARDVRDALERSARERGARFLLDAAVVDVEKNEQEGFRLRIRDGREVHCKTLFLCPGGKSYARTGTTGDGYRWLEEWGLEVVRPVPALVPLASDVAWARELSGVSLQDAEVRLLGPNGKALARRLRPVLFTHDGLSGPGAMDVSVHVARARDAGSSEPFAVALDLYPETDREELRDLFVAAAGDRGAPRLLRVLSNPPARRVLAQICVQAGLDDPNPSLNGVSKKARHALVEALKGFTLPIAGTLGFDKAEVTSGGLALREVDPGSMRVNRVPGLYVFGELLDLDGPIGGLNFQAAFATAELAALDARKEKSGP